MPENKQQRHGSGPEAYVPDKAETKAELKNQNPNQNHNTKKESLGPNTKR